MKKKKMYKIIVQVTVEDRDPKYDCDRFPFQESVEIVSEYETLIYHNWNDMIWNRLLKQALERIQP